MSRTTMIGTRGWLYRWLLPIITRLSPSSSITRAEVKNRRYSSGGFYY